MKGLVQYECGTASSMLHGTSGSSVSPVIRLECDIELCKKNFKPVINRRRNRTKNRTNLKTQINPSNPKTNKLLNQPKNLRNINLRKANKTLERLALILLKLVKKSQLQISTIIISTIKTIKISIISTKQNYITRQNLRKNRFSW